MEECKDLKEAPQARQLVSAMHSPEILKWMSKICDVGHLLPDPYLVGAGYMKSYKGDSLKAYKKNKLKKKHIEELNINQDAVIVDALFGIGLNKKIQGIFKECIDKINNSKLKVIAVDIPSGVYGDNGKIMGEAVKADVTLALHAKKLGHKMYPGSKLSGKIKIIDIGIYQ